MKYQKNEKQIEDFSSIEWLTTQAVAKHKEGKLEEAIAFYLEVIELDENQPAWIYGNAIILLSKLKYYDRGVQLATKALVIHSKSDEIYKVIGLLNWKLRDFKQSIKYYQKAVKLNIKQPFWVYTQLIEGLIKQNQTDDALKLAESIKINNNNQSHWLKYSLANAYAQKNMLEEAKQLYIQALIINPDFLEATEKLNLITNEKVVERIKDNTLPTTSEINQATKKLKLLSANSFTNYNSNFIIEIDEIGLGGLIKCKFICKEEVSNTLQIKVLVDEKSIAKIKLSQIQSKTPQEFEFFIPLLLLDDQEHKFKFICSPGNQSIEASVVIPRRSVGRIEHFQDNYIVGWLLPDEHFGDSAKLDIYIDDIFFTQAKADLQRLDLSKHGLGNGNSGFKVFLPLPPKPEKIYKIDAYFSGTKTSLKHSPISVTALNKPIAESLFQAKITDFHIGGIATGWAINHSNPSQNPKVKILVDGDPIGVIQASTLSHSNSTESLGEIPKEFQIQLPFTILDNQEHQFELVLIEEKQSITQSIKMNIIIPRLITGRIDGWHDNHITGWAVPEGHYGKPAFLDMYLDGTFYQEIRANKPRKDLLKYNLGSGRNGFEVAMPILPDNKMEYSVDIFYKGTNQKLQRSPINISYSSLPEKYSPNSLGRFANLHRTKNSFQNQTVTIVIPVFNAYEELSQCLKSVFKYTSIRVKLVIVNDCSTDTRIPRLLDWAATYSNVTVLDNQPNLGYTKTINKGIDFAPDDDIVLLNSDTEVGPYWLQNLRNAVYHQFDIATATAISDNSGAFSVPNVGHANNFPIWLNKEEMIRAVKQNSKIIYPETPTGSGFCIYIRREVFNEIGMFDEISFPRGYGEENDFCMRAVRAGWRNIVDDRTLVYHVRSASFRDEKISLYDSGRNVVDERYPDYRGQVSVFVHSPQMNLMRYGIRKFIEGKCSNLINKPLPRILFVISTQTGGTPQTNKDLMDGLQNQYSTMVLRCDTTQIFLYDTTGGQESICESFKLQSPITLTSHHSSEYENILGDLLINYAIEILHVRHIGWHSLSLCRVAKKLGLTVIFSFHDFYAICPTVNLLDENQVFCGGTCTKTEGDCSVPLWRNNNHVPKLKHSFINAWREMIANIFPHIDAFVTTSISTKKLIVEIYPELKQQNFEVIPHGRDFSQLAKEGNGNKISINQPLGSKPLSILFPGNIHSAKGLDLILALKALDTENKLEFHFLGTIAESLKSAGVYHGSYKREEFNQIVNKIQPSYIGVFSIWPETYCHTLTESWASGIPVIAIDLGAVGERIKQHGGGWLISPNLDSQKVYDRLLQIASKSDEYMVKVSEVIRWQLSYGRQNGIATMARKYHQLYQSAINSSLAFRDNNPAEKSKLIIKLGVFIHCSDNNQSPPSAHIRVLEWLQSYVVSQHIDFQIIDADSFIYDSFNVFELDMVLVQRNTIKPHLVNKFINHCKQNNLPIIFEIDDDLTNVPKEKDPMGIYAQTERGIQAIIQASSTVIVSTEALRKKFSQYNSNTVIIPNTICEYAWFKPMLPENNSYIKDEDKVKFKILYMGNPTHAEDLALIKPVFENLANDGYLIQLYVIGGESKEKNNESMWYERIEIPSEFRHYPQFVPWFRNITQNFNLAIAPLVNTEFNQCKSPLKYLQYSAMGLPSICSDVTPYKEIIVSGSNGILVENIVEKWQKMIVNIFNDPEALEKISNNAREFIIENYRMSNYTEAYANIFRKLLVSEKIK